MIYLNPSLIKTAKLVSDIVSDPNELDFVEFLIPTIIVTAIIAVLATCVSKYAFELDKEKSINLFWIVAGAIIGISIIGYFIV